MKKSKTKKIPSSEAELKRLLKKSTQKYLVAMTLGMGTKVTMYTSDNVPTEAIWAMPLADIIKKRAPLTGITKKLRRAIR